MTAIFNVLTGNRKYNLFITPGLVAPTKILIGGPASVVAGTATVNLLVLKMLFDDNGAVGGGPFNAYVFDWSESRRIANSLSGYIFISHTLNIYANQNTSPTTFNTSVNIRSTANITGNVVPYASYSRIENGATVTGNWYAFYAANVGNLDGTITGSYNSFRAEFVNGSALVSVTNVSALDAPWDISGITTLTGYSAIVSADINGNNKAFTIYGTRIDIDGTMAGTATWRGYYLNAAGVTCGATRAFYGIDMDFTGITGGGDIRAVSITSDHPTISAGYARYNGWSNCVGLSFQDHFDGNVTWAVAAGTGIKWVTTLAGGAVAQINPARSGIISITTLNAINTPAYFNENNVLQWSIQDKPWIFSRWRAVDVTLIYFAVGLTDLVAAAVPYTNNAILFIANPTINANYIFRAVRAAGVIDINSTVAIDNLHHKWEFRMNSNGTDMDCYFDGVLRGSFTAAQLPVNTTMMQRVIFTMSTEAITAKAMRIDEYAVGLYNNAGTGDT